MIGANDKQAGEYTKVLAAIVTRMKDETVRKRLMAAPKAEDALKVLTE
jgi:mannitol/fructose-specific phosphotransferase system IIA component (Ntr-type)